MNFISNFFKKKKNFLIKAPLSGKIINIKKVPDVVFSKKIVGDGIAIDPSDNKIVAPFDGKISKIFRTLHAFSIESKIDGVQLFVHFGIDTIKMNGKGFKCHVKENQNLKTGELILTVDLNLLKKESKSIITPIIISNTEDFKKIKKKKGNVILGKNTIMKLTK
ncbi:glucose PTS transporter subunit IIA [Buchnera aphidicola]|uniref:glucose PTS transporter subunit IIA n=1 Tax=Buchnera aphidicola TaxID=9 RepID=UPI0030EE6D18